MGKRTPLFLPAFLALHLPSFSIQYCWSFTVVSFSDDDDNCDRKSGGDHCRISSVSISAAKGRRRSARRTKSSHFLCPGVQIQYSFLRLTAPRRRRDADGFCCWEEQWCSIWGAEWNGTDTSYSSPLQSWAKNFLHVLLADCHPWQKFPGWKYIRNFIAHLCIQFAFF